MNFTDNQKDMNFKKLTFLLKKLSLEFPVADLSRKLPYAESTISPYLNGKVKPSTKFLQSIMDNFEITLDGFENEYLHITSEPAEIYGFKNENLELKKIIREKDKLISAYEKIIENLEDKIQMLEFSLGKKNGTA